MIRRDHEFGGYPLDPLHQVPHSRRSPLPSAWRRYLSPVQLGCDLAQAGSAPSPDLRDDASQIMRPLFRLYLDCFGCTRLPGTRYKMMLSLAVPLPISLDLRPERGLGPL